jgi:hypothetical protein
MTLDTEIGRVDLLAAPDDAPPYAILRDRAVEVRLGAFTGRVASIDDLIAMKRAANRPKDQVHVMELQALKRLAEVEAQL